MKRMNQAIVAALGFAIAGPVLASNFYDRAWVERVDRIVAIVDQPQSATQCWDQPRSEYHPGADYRRDTVVPTYDNYGNRTDAVIHSDVVESGGYTTTQVQRVCQTQTQHQEARQVMGYDVVYRWRGQDYHDRMDHDPGRWVKIHIQDGYVELAE
jgi:hypothetical protein